MVVLSFSLVFVIHHSEDLLPSIHADKYYPCELVGTWNTWYGEQDQAGKIISINTWTSLLIVRHVLMSRVSISHSPHCTNTLCGSVLSTIKVKYLIFGFFKLTKLIQDVIRLFVIKNVFNLLGNSNPVTHPLQAGRGMFLIIVFCIKFNWYLFVFFSPVHLWRYRGGYPALTEVMNKLKQNKVKAPSQSFTML